MVELIVIRGSFLVLKNHEGLVQNFHGKYGSSKDNVIITISTDEILCIQL